MRNTEFKGGHSAFYYYGTEHLFVNLYKYIKDGIRKNEQNFVCMEKDLYNKLLNLLEINKIPMRFIKPISVKEYILCYKLGGLNALKTKINDIAYKSIEKGYSGVRLIGQVSFAIQETSKEDFSAWEETLTSIYSTQLSIMCLYDFYDYLNAKKLIDEQVLGQSLLTHTHIMQNFNLVENNMFSIT